MSLLRGNYKAKEVNGPVKQAESLEERFEKAATARLGGSICYVKKQKVMWGHESRDAEK